MEMDDSNRDRLSELPDPILLHILSFLPAVDAVFKAAYVSKRWTSLIPELPSLVFVEPVKFTNALINFQTFVDRTLIQYDFHHLQRFCIAYRIRCTEQSKIDSWISFAVRRKSVKVLELLALRTFPPCNHHKGGIYCLPRFLFKHEALVALSLRSCVVKEHPGKITWTSLKSLSIEDTDLSSLPILREISAGCPVLESLKLVRCHEINELFISSEFLKELVLDHCTVYPNHYILGTEFRIFAPNLRVLVISGFMSYKQFLVSDMPLLAEATFNEEPFKMVVTRHSGRAGVRRQFPNEDIGDNRDIETRKSLVMQFLKRSQHVNKLAMGSWCLQVFSIESLPYSFSNCKSLTLDTNLKQWELDGLKLVIQRCPKLESLTINMWTTMCDRLPIPKQAKNSGATSQQKKKKKKKSDRKSHQQKRENSDELDDNEVDTYSKGVKYPCLEQHLKIVKIFNLNPIASGGPSAIEVLEFLLKHGRVLERLSITTTTAPKQIHEDEDICSLMELEEDSLFDHCLFKMLSSLPSSSPGVEIEIY